MIVDLDAYRRLEGSPELFSVDFERRTPLEKKLGTNLRAVSPLLRNKDRRPAAPVWPAVLFFISILFWALVILGVFAVYGIFTSAQAAVHLINS